MKRILMTVLALATLSAAIATPVAQFTSPKPTPIKYEPCLPC